MAKCKNCTNLYNMSNENDEIVGKWCPKTNDSPDVESERECRHYKCMTQADRIRSMSDEKLAEFLPIVSDFMCKPTDKCMENIFNHGECEKRKECALKWLQSEVEV